MGASSPVAAILRDAAKRPLLRMRSVFAEAGGFIDVRDAPTATKFRIAVK
jgi:hypothetical protein